MGAVTAGVGNARVVEVVVSGWEGKSLLRVSIAPYNEAADVERLLEALAECVAPAA